MKKLAFAFAAATLLAAPAFAMSSSPSAPGTTVARSDYSALTARYACAVKLHTDPNYQAVNWAILGSDYHYALATTDKTTFDKYVAGFNGRMTALGYAC